MLLPHPFINEMTARLGADEAARLFSALEAPYAAALRLNPLRLNPEAAAAPFIDAPVPWCGEGFYIREGTRPGLSPVQAAGGFYIQEASAMAPASLLAAQPGETVLDLCAAPGGKSGQLAAAMKGQGTLVVNEPEPTRVRLLSATIERLGVTNAYVTNNYPDELAEAFGETFDAILVDAPCSGEGMFRRDPESRNEWREGSPEGCAARQAGILDQAARLLKPGGRLVYSTCTFSRCENEGTIEAFLSRHPEFEVETFALNGVGEADNGCLQLWPHRVRGDGQFAARLRKADEDAPAPRRKKNGKGGRPAKPDQETDEAMKRLADIAPDWEARLGAHTIARWGETLFALPMFDAAKPGVKLVRTGLKLCRVGRGYVEPDHALAMALRPDEAARSQSFDEAEALRLLAGETLPSDRKGWTLMTHQNMPLGWGKASDGALKNHIPKGLRLTRG